ncbi:hypothetical protein BJ508DRAFT_307875 [Ascobolus immersus RN42]|uniref:Uncharacterized protein n=1 Tax=Ascobolus immersus RN42 TaxID=1160509 RepID=A0A3N4I1L0_ASCIM|nr:hypothetical protein BJ508DRAFT_307875 [Ascobolus immersus RN42]
MVQDDREKSRVHSYKRPLALLLDRCRNDVPSKCYSYTTKSNQNSATQMSQPPRRPDQRPLAPRPPPGGTDASQTPGPLIPPLHLQDHRLFVAAQTGGGNATSVQLRHLQQAFNEPVYVPIAPGPRPPAGGDEASQYGLIPPASETSDSDGGDDRVTVHERHIQRAFQQTAFRPILPGGYPELFAGDPGNIFPPATETEGVQLQQPTYAQQDADDTHDGRYRRIFPLPQWFRHLVYKT